MDDSAAYQQPLPSTSHVDLSFALVMVAHYLQILIHRPDVPKQVLDIFTLNYTLRTNCFAERSQGLGHDQVAW